MKSFFSMFMIIALLLSFTTVNAQDKGGIDFFEGSWAEVLKASKKEKKPIFVDAYAVWCGPCKWMNANVFTDDSVAEFYNKNFINYKFDMERGEGPQFAGDYQVRAYPTLLFLDATGAVKHRVLGAKQVEDFIQEGESALAKFE